MGLDMYLTGRKFFWYATGRQDGRKEDGLNVKSLDVELGYWRKHPNLHGYIVNTFADGVDNCQEIELSADNLRQIIAAVKADDLPHTEGFFFGSSLGDKQEFDDTLKQLTKALDWLQAGDDWPIHEEPMDGPGFTALAIKPKAEAERKPQNITRSVHYLASW